MEENVEDRGETKVATKNSGKIFKSRVHDKAEKQKQLKAWLKRKRERMSQREVRLNPRWLKKKQLCLKPS